MSTESDIRALDGFFRGEAKQIRFTVRDLSKQVMPVAGWTTEMRISDVKFGASILTRPGVVQGDGTGGIINVLFSAAHTIALVPMGYFYSFRRIDVGSETELAFGDLELLERWVD